MLPESRSILVLPLNGAGARGDSQAQPCSCSSDCWQGVGIAKLAQGSPTPLHPTLALTFGNVLHPATHIRMRVPQTTKYLLLVRIIADIVTVPFVTSRHDYSA